MREHASFKGYSATLLTRNLSKQVYVCLYFTGKHINSILRFVLRGALELAYSSLNSSIPHSTKDSQLGGTAALRDIILVYH